MKIVVLAALIAAAAVSTAQSPDSRREQDRKQDSRSRIEISIGRDQDRDRDHYRDRDRDRDWNRNRDWDRDRDRRLDRWERERIERQIDDLRRDIRRIRDNRRMSSFERACAIRDKEREIDRLQDRLYGRRW